MYCVEWKTRNASPARKSRDESRPATGRSRKPVHAAGERWGDERDETVSVLLLELNKSMQGWEGGRGSGGLYSQMN